MTLSELVHGHEVNRVPPRYAILLGQDLSVASDNITGVLLEERDEAQVELSMPLDRVRIVLHRLYQLSLLDVHGFHSETALFLLQLVIHDFLETHAFEAEQADKAVIFALVGQDVVSVHAVVI